MKRSRATSKGATGLALDVNEALKLKQELNNGEALSQQELIRVLQADKPCDSACKGRKDNPNCLHGLVPAVGSVRRKGLWQKEPQGLMHLGADPAGLKRQVCNIITWLCTCCFKACQQYKLTPEDTVSLVCIHVHACAGQQASLWTQ